MPANNIFQIRRGSSSQWNSSNPVLASGEPGYDITNNIYKIGDGTSNWNNLKSILDITGNATISGILSASSGNFEHLLFSGIPVSVSGHAHDRLTNSDKEVVLDSNGFLTLPSGSIISETNNTVSIAPPTAAPGQSLVIRPTVATWGLTSSGYIVYGSPITISVTLNSWAYFGTVNYTISGSGVTPQSLGRALTGKLTFVSTSAPDTETITWTIPANSNITEFTLTLTSVDGTLSTDPQTQNDPELYYNFEYNGMPTGQFITVTNDGMSNSEHSHVHLVAGDPSTVDIYLGDDDQYVKIQKNGGDVVVGTDSNNNHWIFDTSGNLRTPTNSIISKGYPGLTQDGSSWFVSPSGSLGGLASTDGQQYIQIGDNSEIYIGLGWPNNAVEWIFNRNGSLTLPSGLIFVDNTIQTTAWSGAVSINDITDFASGVSGLLPTVSGSGYAVTSFNNNIYSISVTGLQPSGNYSLDGHNHIIADVSGLQTALDNKQSSGIYASGIHYHVSADISDFTSSVSGLLPVIANSGDNRILTSTGSTVGVNAESNLTFDGNLLSVSGNLVAVSGTYNQLIFNTSLPDPDLSQGQLQWNSSEGTLDLGFTDTYSQHMGEELHYRVRNNTTSTLTKGTAVYASGLTPGGNNRIEVAPFTADGSVREVRFMGLVTENISSGVNGYTTQFGYIRGIDTRGDAASNGYAGKLWDAGEPSWSEGDILYAHPTVAGKLTKVEPKHSISVAIILNRHQNQGKIFVRSTSYGHLNDNHDVSTSGATNGQFLQYNSSTDYWVPSSSGNFSTLLVNGTGVSISGHSHSSSNITDFNTSVSGLLPVTNILGSSNITVSQSGTNFTVAVTGSLGLTTEEVDDRVSNLLVAGSGIVLNYDDNNNILNIDANFSTSLAAGTGISLDYNVSTDELFINTSGLQPSGNYSLDGHTHTTSNITDFNSSVSGLLPVTNILGGTNISIVPSGSIFTVNVSGSLGLTTEEVDDRVSQLLVAGSGITLDYNDGSNTLTITNNSISPDEIEEYITTSGFPPSGDLNTLYVATNTAQIFKWDGEVYYEAGPQGASTGSHAVQHTTDNSDPIPLKEYIVPQFTSNTNNLAHNNKDILYISADANNRELSGLIAPSFCVAKLLVNISSTNTIILDHQSTNSDPSNRFIIYTGSDYYLLPGYSVSIVYDTNASRWRAL